MKCAVITGSSLVNTTSDVRAKLMPGSHVVIDGTPCRVSDSTAEWTPSTIALQQDWAGDTNFDAVLELKAPRPKRSPSKLSQPRKNTASAVPASDIHAAVSQLDTLMSSLPPTNHAAGIAYLRNERTAAAAAGDGRSRDGGGSSKLPVLRRPASTAAADAAPAASARKKVYFDDSNTGPGTSVRTTRSAHASSSSSSASAASLSSPSPSAARAIDALPALAEITRELKAMKVSTGQGYETEHSRQLALARVTSKLREDTKRAQEDQAFKEHLREQQRAESERKAAELRRKTLERVALLKEKERQRKAEEDAAAEEARAREEANRARMGERLEAFRAVKTQTLLRMQVRPCQDPI